MARLDASKETTIQPPAISVVGIGASAGGIEALGRFFDAMPADSGCAFVVVLHLDPKHESEMRRNAVEGARALCKMRGGHEPARDGDIDERHSRAFDQALGMIDPDA
ncbi:chemotaxis protein CheB [Mesorhizobium abyssinicae]|uniref:Chemotaxis protein CheB n=1 Tax=Mesorhizobium abyssinicae TaxID=1209958 RepID=A0ABU5AXC2_9HYPH|nr:chemotaxis protein CheB [Mesorhizobium abyssinicae]MDX8541974.1 chemotaxis protein CheB [Mesorhizobium abyssinicae]